MKRISLIILPLLLLLIQNSWGADKNPVFSQKNLVQMIMQQFSWNDGLPKEPADRDYLLIMGGKRTYRYEAETSYNPETDWVSVKEFPLFGEFTGSGWLSGVSNATSATFTVLLPIGGEYNLKAAIKGSGYIWNIDNTDYPASSKNAQFQETDIAKLSLKAGTVVIKVAIPPEGAIDSLTLTATNYPPVQPFTGWRFKDSLTAGRMAEVVVALTNRYAELPDENPELPPKQFNVSEMVVLPTGASLTKADYLGAFSSSSWVRADFRGANLQIPFTVAEKGYYVVTANIMGEVLSGSINDNSFNLAGKPYLSKTVLGVDRLEAGDNRLFIKLPPVGGIDSFELTRKSTRPENFLQLSGVPGPVDRLVNAGEATAILKKIQGAFPIRK